MNSENIARLDSLFGSVRCAVKDRDAIGIGKDNTPQFVREPKWEECFAKAFLERMPEYSDIVFHDKQGENDSQNSLDLTYSSDTFGVEVTQAINDAYRAEESKWNKALSEGKSNKTVHKWKNQPTSLHRIKCAVCKKLDAYEKYKKRYPNIKDIDLFVYIVDANIVHGDFHTLSGFIVPKNIGYKPNEDIGNALCLIMNEMKIPYRKVFFVFGNYWYIYESGKIENCIMPDGSIEALNAETYKIWNHERKEQ